MIGALDGLPVFEFPDSHAKAGNVRRTLHLRTPGVEVHARSAPITNNAAPNARHHVVRRFVVKGKWIEEGLNKCVVSGVQDDARQDAACFDAHAGPHKVQQGDGQREDRDVEPDRGLASVVREKDDR